MATPLHIITRTIYGTRLQALLLMKLPYVMVPNTTLNERFDIQAGVAPMNGEVPRLGYFGIGQGGHRAEVGADGIPFTSPIQHSPSDASAYRPIPFLLREPAEDLTVQQREGYALRKEIEVNGEPYIAYYLKRIDLSNVNVAMLFNSIADGVTTTIPFVPTSANLNPTAPPIPPSGSNTTSGDDLAVSALIDLGFTDVDVEELVNVAQLMYNNSLLAVVSELYLVAAAEKIVTVPAPVGGGTINYREAICATVITHITAHYSVGYTNKGFDYDLDLGATEPLMGLGNV